jgi:rhodanese-related sulfurtransferase
MSLPAWAASDPLRDALQGYLEFAEYAEGAISAEQLIDVGLDAFLLVDTRMHSQFVRDHLPGAVNIEWREIVSREAEMLTNKPVLLYCDTGLLSAKAYLALRLLGHDNLKVLFGGLNEWKMHHGLRTPEP